MAAVGCTNVEIAEAFKISDDTLVRNYSDALTEGRSEFKTSLRTRMWQRAECGSDTMLIWLSKNTLGMSDKVEATHSGPDGGPIEFLATNIEKIYGDNSQSNTSD